MHRICLVEVNLINTYEFYLKQSRREVEIAPSKPPTYYGDGAIELFQDSIRIRVERGLGGLFDLNRSQNLSLSGGSFKERPLIYMQAVPRVLQLTSVYTWPHSLDVF